ncbi:YdcF family protein [Wohlfahrtiimonas populi]|uniref:YdcF family protein n=1 Tax=Wohlfahrtiimonas populi TaxID=1940240 RepID=UPI00098D243F|nr:YdcF family protein [Wohlfahrtiimonas populi]
MKKLFRITLLVTGSIFLIDAIILIALKKINLGSILPFLIGLIFCYHAIYYKKIIQYLATNPKLKKYWKLGWIGLTCWFISLFFFFIYIHQQNQLKDEIKHTDAIIVLGAGIVNDQPSWALAERLDKASHIFHSTENALIIVTGGLGMKQTLTEAEVMSSYLQKSHNIPSEKIALEDKSTSTELNLKNSQPILKEYGLDNNSAVVIVTNDFHTIRASAIAKKLGFTNVSTAGAMTPLPIRYNAWLREYFAFISGWLLNEY